jgi:peptidoglycan/xylan/chitin deacetylase (PgdA/CDA1 family)
MTPRVSPTIPAEAAVEEVRRAPLVRAINYHNTPERDREILARQLRGLAGHVAPVDEAGLEARFDGRPLADDRPGLVPVLWEGYRNNYDVGLELIEQAGLTAWVFVPVAFIDTPVAEQHRFAHGHHILLAGEDPERVAMTWGELRDIVARGHVIACHTASHCGIQDIVTDEDAERELIAPKRRLEEQLGIEVHTLAWLWGTPYGMEDRLDEVVRQAGYRFVFSNTKIQRLPR